LRLLKSLTHNTITLFSIRNFYLLGLLILSSCATQPPVIQQANQKIHEQHIASLSSIQSYSINGRLGVIYSAEYKGFSGSITWQHDANTDNVDIFTPLGSKAANITKSPNEVIFTADNGKMTKAQDAETLTLKTMGWRLPLSGLSDWALGRASNAPITSAAWDEQGRLTSLDQAGWHIEYQNYENQSGTALPTKITIKTDQVRLKLLIEAWQIH
jgi:outer membrane lipoprotein LolB